MPQDVISVRLQVQNQTAHEELKTVISSAKGFHLQNGEPSKHCNLLILEIGEDVERELQMIHDFHTSGAADSIFVTSPRFESDLLIQVLRAGVKEFLAQPIRKEELLSALVKLRERNASLAGIAENKKRGKIIHVIGGKGGVGTTTVAVNLSAMLTELGSPRSVVLIDMNLLFGEIPIFLDLKSDFDWGEVVKNISRVDATFLKSILVDHPSGICVLPSPTTLDGMNVATPKIIASLLDVMKETFDFIVIDGGQSLGDISLKILEMSDAVLVVSILNLPCLSNVKRLLWTFQKLGYPQKEHVKIVMNRYHKKSLISLSEAEQSIGQEIFWQIPNDFQTTMSAINQGKLLSSVDTGADINKNFRMLASSFIKREEQDREKKGFLSRWIS